MRYTIARIVLVVLEAFIALTAIVSGVLGLTGGLYIPLEWLHGTPFSDYTIPMLILIIVVGGSSLIAAATLFFHREWSVILSAEAGIMMAGFEVVQLAIMQRFSWLQVFYFVTGMAVFAVAFYLWIAEYGRHRFQSRQVGHIG
ncbi:MAG TPA: hypothetical protein VFQ30_13115 [Ktedonobacteraceae bacterium]|nr:hypothetical protein [Ktedonobacteraceae bacterium]